MKSQKKPFFRRAHAAVFAAIALALSTSAHAQTSTWDGGSTTSNSWGSLDNWDPNIAPTFNTSRNLVFNNLTRPANDLGGARTVRSISYGANMDSDFLTNFRSFNGGVAADLTLQAASGNASINVDAGASGNISLGWGGTGTAGGALVLGSNLDVVHNGSGNLIFSRRIDGIGFGFTKSGTGTMVVSNFPSNGFTGAANFNEGRAIFGNTSSATGDLNSASAVNLGGGTLEIRTSTAFNKTLTPNTAVSSASILAFNNTATTDQSLTVSTGTMVLNGNLTVQNISSSTAGNNIINITRNLTGSGNLIVDTYNNVASGAVSFSNGRVQLQGNNTGWTGNLVVAKGTAQFSGNNSFVPTAGSITLGTTGNAFGAALGFNQGNTDSNVTNAITVTTGGVRLIRNNSGPDTTANITLSGAIDLQGSLTLDHAGLGAGKSITVSGKASGAGGLNVSFVGPHAIADSPVRLTGENDYTGATNVSSGTLVINGNQALATGAVSVSGKLAGSGTVGGATTINSGGVHNAGDPTVAGGVGTQTFTNTLSYISGSIFEWDITSSLDSDGAGLDDGAAGTDFDNVAGAGTKSAASGSIFKVVLGGNALTDIQNSENLFWNTPSTTQVWNQANIFSSFSGGFTQVQTSTDVSARGSFTITGSSLTWTAVPEPSSALVGLLVGAGLLRRRRA